MIIAAKSDKGLCREKNEDSYLVISNVDKIPNICLVADGMGGHNSGEVASNMAVKLAADYVLANPNGFKKKKIHETLRNMFTHINSKIYSDSMTDTHLQGMGTTFIAAVFIDNILYVGHVGDSRAYIIRDNKIERITTDHSLIEELVIGGYMTREEAEHHPQKNLITRAVGCLESVEADVYEVKIEKGDIFVFCTDGLTNMISEEEIKDIVLNNQDLEKACEILINSANDSGGHDNCTVVVVRV